MAQQIAQVASEFERQRTGHSPQSVNVVMSGDTLVITLHGSLSAGEKILCGSPDGAAKVHEFHRQLFMTSCAMLLEKIKAITGVGVREAKAELGTSAGGVAQVFATGTMVQVYLLAGDLPMAGWSGSDPESPRHLTEIA